MPVFSDDPAGLRLDLGARIDLDDADLDRVNFGGLGESGGGEEHRQSRDESLAAHGRHYGSLGPDLTIRLDAGRRRLIVLRLRLNLNLMIRSALILALASFALTAASRRQRLLARRPVVERRVACMGTLLDWTIVGRNREQALAASEQRVVEITPRRGSADDLAPDSPLSRLDERARSARTVPLDSEIFGVLAEVLAWAAAHGKRVRSDGASADARLGPARIAGASPRPQAARRPRRPRDPLSFAWTRRAARPLDSIRRGIDEGAWGKGYALDRAAARAPGRSRSVSALIDLGGQIARSGQRRDGRPSGRSRSPIRTTASGPWS